MSSDKHTAPFDLLKEAVRPGMDGKCCRCQRLEHDDGTPVTWKCAQCGKNVCRDCTLTLSHPTQRVYYDDTLCSEECWKQIGSPNE